MSCPTVPCRPAAHFTFGGIEVDDQGTVVETSGPAETGTVRRRHGNAHHEGYGRRAVSGSRPGPPGRAG
ncbi:hypothetical protein ACWD7C_32555 [Streptomyces sp. NPDC005134]|uniref:hypothetical protein n=1 Tax=unclassified Streptomyces TaxID=2593676 RepID=UPI0033B8B122